MMNLQKATKTELVSLIEQCFSGDAQEVFAEANEIKMQHFGEKVYIRGLVEITNYCRNNCFYCGIRASNQNVKRYRLETAKILECCKSGYELGFRTFVLQGGEDAYYTDEYLGGIIRELKKRYPDAAVTLSLGEKSYESYKRLFEAGADRYLLRHETASEDHYQKLHPQELSFSNRQESLLALKAIGYQTGAGFMVGSPGQRIENLAEDLLFLRELKPQMVGIGPFIPHQDTRFAKMAAGDLHQTLCMLALTRILLPTALLPSTTALGTIAKGGMEQGLLAGGNVIMPNLSPKQFRKDYSLYDGKVHDSSEVAERLEALAKRLKIIDLKIDMSRGDYKEKIL